MKKTDVIRAMADLTGLSRPDAKAALNAFATVVVEALKAGDTVQLTGFANFKPIAMRERMVSNPRTRQMMPLPARTRVTVRMARGVKEYLDRDRPAGTMGQSEGV